MAGVSALHRVLCWRTRTVWLRRRRRRPRRLCFLRATAQRALCACSAVPVLPSTSGVAAIIMAAWRRDDIVGGWAVTLLTYQYQYQCVGIAGGWLRRRSARRRRRRRRLGGAASSGMMADWRRRLFISWRAAGVYQSACAYASWRFLRRRHCVRYRRHGVGAARLQRNIVNIFARAHIISPLISKMAYRRAAGVAPDMPASEGRL